MGEIASDHINGACCSWCGCYFIEEHGFPVVCRECYNQWRRENHLGKKAFKRKEGIPVASYRLV